MNYVFYVIIVIVMDLLPTRNRKQGLITLSINLFRNEQYLIRAALGEEIFWELNKHHTFLEMNCMHTLENSYGTKHGGGWKIIFRISIG